MINSRINYLIVLFLTAISLLCSCDTASTIEAPTNFIKYYGGDGDQEGVDVVVDGDGFIYLLGNTTSLTSTTGKQVYLVKTDADGLVIWEKTIGGKFEEEAKDLELAGNRLVVLANSKKGAAENDILLMTFSTDGAKLDSVLVGLKTNSGAEADEDASSISITSDGFIISGSTTSVNSKGGNPIGVDDRRDALHLRFTNNLVIFNEGNWKPTSGTSGTDGASKFYQVNASTYYGFGYSNINVSASGVSDFNFWIFQLGATGDPSNSQMYPGALTTNDVLTSVITPSALSTEGFLLAGTSVDASGNFDIYLNKLRKSLTFNPSLDYQINKVLSVPLGKPEVDKAKVSVYRSVFSGYLLLANEKSATTNNFYLTKINNDGLPAWNNPQNLIFGGQKEDYIGAVSELADGKIILVGTMSLGDESQKKMALIKVNNEGKFLD